MVVATLTSLPRTGAVWQKYCRIFPSMIECIYTLCICAQHRQTMCVQILQILPLCVCVCLCVVCVCLCVVLFICHNTQHLSMTQCFLSLYLSLALPFSSSHYFLSTSFHSSLSLVFLFFSSQCLSLSSFLYTLFLFIHLSISSLFAAAPHFLFFNSFSELPNLVNSQQSLKKKETKNKKIIDSSCSSSTKTGNCSLTLHTSSSHAVCVCPVQSVCLLNHSGESQLRRQQELPLRIGVGEVGDVHVGTSANDDRQFQLQLLLFLVVSLILTLTALATNLTDKQTLP